MTDYFLQNRPMLVGLPGSVLGSLLFYLAFKNHNPRLLVFAAIVSGLLAQFQPLAPGVVVLSACISWFIFSRRKIFNLVLPILIISLFFLPVVAAPVNGSYAAHTVFESFSFGPWDNTKSFSWHITFLLANFGLPLVISFFGFFYFLVVAKTKSQAIIFLSLWFLILVAIPYFIRFTIFGWDMFKFFYFMTVPMAILASIWLVRIWRPVAILIIVISCLTSLLVLGNSYLNKWAAYSSDDYSAGLWIRKNTPSQAVFISLPTVHDPPTQIGGRLRVLSYINWPYSHGYNAGPDNVFTRRDDIDKFYDTSQLSILKKYHVNYIYYGPEEKREYPHFNPSGYKLVYNSDTISIYEVF